jgi:hypothetical protein
VDRRLYHTCQAGLEHVPSGVEGRSRGAEAGLAMLDEALALVEQTGMRSCEAEIHRLRGELLLQSAGYLPESSKLSGKLAGT